MMINGPLLPTSWPAGSIFTKFFRGNPTLNFHLHLDDEQVQHIPAGEPLNVEPEVSIRVVMERLKQENDGGILICENGKLAGIFTERDALRLMAERADLDTPIGQVMTFAPVTIQATSTVGEGDRHDVGWRLQAAADRRREQSSDWGSESVTHHELSRDAFSAVYL